MINLMVTIFGGLMIIAGFYAMSFGFSTPPNILFFLLGLILAVAGLFLVIIFSSGIEMPSGSKVSPAPRYTSPPAPTMKPRPKPVKVEKKEKKVVEEDKKKETLETIQKIKPQPRIRQPKKVERPDMSNKPAETKTSKLPPEVIGNESEPKTDIGKSSTSTPQFAAFKSTEKVEKPKSEPPKAAERIAPVKKPKTEEPKKIEPAKADKTVSKPVEPVKVDKPVVEKIKPVKAEQPVAEPVKPAEVEKTEPVKPRIIPRIRRPVKKEKEPEIIVKHDEPERPVNLKEKVGKPIAGSAVPEQGEYRKIEPVKADGADEVKKAPVIRRPDLSKLRSKKPSGNEDDYVKRRLERMKDSYIQNTKDIESIIDERMDSFKGTLGKLKSESQEPGIIWSFDAGDVQEAMKDTISKANTRILMMYPWIRNIDVGILKKFMDTESCIIVQEASLDDDASVELLKLLQDRDVKIRTMPHVHTIAVVADGHNGLIISTDPIYESYEVGVIYKDQKSIEEIERMFHDAWEISQDIDLEIK